MSKKITSSNSSKPSVAGVIGMIAMAGITIGASLLMDKVLNDQKKKKEEKEKEEPEAIEQDP